MGAPASLAKEIPPAPLSFLSEPKPFTLAAIALFRSSFSLFSVSPLKRASFCRSASYLAATLLARRSSIVRCSYFAIMVCILTLSSSQKFSPRHRFCSVVCIRYIGRKSISVLVSSWKNSFLEMCPSSSASRALKTSPTNASAAAGA